MTMILLAIPKTSSISCSQKRMVRPSSFRQLLYEVDAARGLFGRHAGGRLVEDQELRVTPQGYGDLQDLPVPVGKGRAYQVPLSRRGPRSRRFPPSRSVAMLTGRGKHVPCLVLPRETATRTFSKTVSSGKDVDHLEGARNALSAHSYGGIPVMSSPLKSTFPESGFSIPVMRLKSVVFPAPFGPITATISPFFDAEVSPVDRLEA